MGEHNRGIDKSRRLKNFHDENPTDTSVADTPVQEDSTPEVDLAYQILSEAGKDNPIYFKNLIRQVIEKKNIAVQNEAVTISEIYTMINMDSRFQHAGDGFWGLTDWYPPETKRSRSTTKTAAKTS